MAFYDIYVKLTNRAIDAYVKAGRRKFALRLHGSLAAMDVLVMTVYESSDPISQIPFSVTEVNCLPPFKHIHRCQLITRRINGHH
jgi:hypothetical protein